MTESEDYSVLTLSKLSIFMPRLDLVQAERSEILQRAIGGLRPLCRMALILRVWDELPYEAIVARFAANGVNLTERTIRQYVAQGMECCRKAILDAEARH